MRIQRYQYVSPESVSELNHLLRQGWQTVREVSTGETGADGRMLVLLEKESDFPQFPAAELIAGVPVSFLAGVMLFDDFTMAEIKQVVAKCEIVTVKPGEGIFSRGDAADALFVVLDGQVEVMLQDLPTQEASVAVLQPGGVFGESTFFSETPHTMSASCGSDPVTLLSLGRAEYDELFQSGEVAALKLANNAARILAGRLQETDDWVWELLQQAQLASISASWRRFRHRVSATDHHGGGFFGL